MGNAQKAFMRTAKYLLLAFSLTLAFASASFACDDLDSDGLDVGLVLSGGGAKASTQVGVMQVMDELEIPVHCITGTSMGAVVGAFYANGYSANDISDILTDNDWGTLFRGQVPRRDKSFIEKEREAQYYSGNVASYGADGLKLPGGLSSMQGLKSYYRQILREVPIDMNFDDMIIPFRAIATNLHLGQKTVFEKGDVVEAILASMAVPGVFPPRQIGSSLYVDGGLSSNLPIQAAKDMGADIIIAIDVSNDPIDPTPGISVASTANQITTIVIWQKVQEELAAYKGEILYLRPNEDIDITTAGYERAAEGLEAGRITGEAVRERLLEIKAKAAPMRRNSDAYKIKEQPSKVRIANNTTIDNTVLQRRLEWQKGHRLDDKDQERRLREIASFGGFGEVDIGRSKGETVLRIEKNPLGRNLVQVGLNATNDFDGNSTYSILARITRKPLGRNGGDISLSGEFGTDLGLSAELYQPFGKSGRYFVQPELFATYHKEKFELFGERLPDLWRRDIGVRGRIGRELGSWGIFAFEGAFSNQKISETVDIDGSSDPVKLNLGSAGVYFGVDTFDRNDWPTSGQKLKARVTRIFDLDRENSYEIDQFEAAWLGAFSIGDYGTLWNVRYGNSPDRHGLGSGSFSLGGFRQMSAYGNNSIVADEYKFLSVEAFKRITERGQLLELPIYVGVIGEYVEFPVLFFESEETVNALAGTFYLGIDTPLGPAFLGGSYGSDDTSSFFFKFGRTF